MIASDLLRAPARPCVICVASSFTESGTSFYLHSRASLYTAQMLSGIVLLVSSQLAFDSLFLSFFFAFFFRGAAARLRGPVVGGAVAGAAG